MEAVQKLRQERLIGNRQKQIMRKAGDGISASGELIEPTSVLRCTEKAMNAALLIQERCTQCHNSTVREVIGAMTQNGARYGMADLKYDIKHQRLEVLPPDSDAGQIPAGRARAEAPLAGKPLPAASMEEFFKFLQCQLRMEMQHHCDGKVLNLQGKDTCNMWPDVEAFVTPNLGNTERWVPYHTILGVHELFLVQEVHSDPKWDSYKRFLAMFVFRAHCKKDLFSKVQQPLMYDDSFWKSPKQAFRPDGPMEKKMLAYRRKTGQPMITNCFRIIPPRVLQDDDENLVRSITTRTIALLGVAEKAYPIMMDSTKGPQDKMRAISDLMQEANGCGETWAKMLTVCIDLAYPSEKLLESQCDVGTGAAPALKALVPKATDKKAALGELLSEINASNSRHAQDFWTVLKTQETCVRQTFAKNKLICAQANTKERAMSAVTLQVQLCEYRQFRHSIARHKYGLPDDSSMRGEIEKPPRSAAETFIEVDKAKAKIVFAYPTKEGGKVRFEMPLKAVCNNGMVAHRVASLCFAKVSNHGATEAEMLKFRDELVANYRRGVDVPETSEAWIICKSGVTGTAPVVAFQFESKDGKSFPLQVTTKAAGGILEAERISRLCWEKLTSGASKDETVEYRNQLYKDRDSATSSAAGAQTGPATAPFKSSKPQKRPAASAGDGGASPRRTPEKEAGSNTTPKPKALPRRPSSSSSKRARTGK